MNKETNKVIIVEGKNDYLRLKRIYPDIDILITNGLAVNDEFLEMVKKLSISNEIILMLDPDHSGEVIRKKITKVCPNASHVFVNKKDAISKNKRKVGIEHVELKVLKAALGDIKKPCYNHNITIGDLYDLGLAGDANSSYKRKKLCDELNIGYVNAKQLVERLNLFNYSLEDIKDKL